MPFPELRSVPSPFLTSDEVRLFVRAWALGFLLVLLFLG